MPIYYKKVSESESSHFLTFIATADDNCSTGPPPLTGTARNSVNSEPGNVWHESALELSSIELETPLVDQIDDVCAGEAQKLETKHGPIWLSEQSDPALPATAPVVLTLHDIGLNHRSNFAHFFAQSEICLLLRGFRVIHLTLPGQQDGADRLPLKYRFPTLERMSEMIDFALTYSRIESFIGFGQGMGANILLRFAMRRPQAVRGLLLIHPTGDRASWSEWFFQRRNARLLRDEQQPGLSPTVVQYFLWSQYGRMDEPRVQQLAAELRGRFRIYPPNPYNLASLIDVWLERDALLLQRPPTETRKQSNSSIIAAFQKNHNSNSYNTSHSNESTTGSCSHQISCDVLLVTGQRSPHLNAVEQLFSKLNPRNSSCIRFPDCANPIEEQPNKLAQAMALFLQGMGFRLPAFQRRQSLRAGLSMPSLTLIAAE